MEPEGRRAGEEGGAGALLLLYDVYGGLLTATQRRVFRLRHHLDLSLAEIAQAEKVSRQAVLDTLRRSYRVLLQAERQLGLLRRWRHQREIVARLKDQLACLDEDGPHGPRHARALRQARRLVAQLERSL